MVVHKGVRIIGLADCFASDSNRADVIICWLDIDVYGRGAPFYALAGSAIRHVELRDLAEDTSY